MDAVAGDYLQFVAARARPNTLLANAYDLKVFLRRGREGTSRFHHARRARVPEELPRHGHQALMTTLEIGGVGELPIPEVNSHDLEDVRTGCTP